MKPIGSRSKNAPPACEAEMPTPGVSIDNRPAFAGGSGNRDYQRVGAGYHGSLRWCAIWHARLRHSRGGSAATSMSWAMH